MTKPAKLDTRVAQASSQALPLLADKKELLRLRIRPAEFARLLGVSKQAVSDWIKLGKIPPPSLLDGRLDVQRSINEVLRNCDPGRLRSRVLRQAVDEVQQLRDNLALAEDRAEKAERALADALDRLDQAEHTTAEADHFEEGFKRLVREREAALRATPDTEAWGKMLAGIDLELAEAWLAEHPEFDMDDFDTGLEIDRDTVPLNDAAREAQKEGGGGLER